MENERKTTLGSGWSVAAVFSVAALSLFLLYVLSSGPMFWLKTHGYVSNELCTALYYPLAQLSLRFEWFSRLWTAYVQLWPA